MPSIFVEETKLHNEAIVQIFPRFQQNNHHQERKSLC